MSHKESNNNQESELKDALTQIDKIAKDPEEKILLEDSIKSIIKEADIFIEHIKDMDKERRKELLGIYDKILDGLRQKVKTLT